MPPRIRRVRGGEWVRGHERDGAPHPPGCGKGSAASETEPLESVGPALPVLLNPHPRLEVDLSPEQGLDLFARLPPGLFENRSLLPDDDALLRLSFDKDPHRDLEQ